jgi:hypothetical protein
MDRALPQPSTAAEGRIDTGGISREARIERIENATRQVAGLPRRQPNFAIANLVHQVTLSKPRWVPHYRGKAGTSQRREIVTYRYRRGSRRNRKDYGRVPTFGDIPGIILGIISGHLALLPIGGRGLALAAG